MINNIMKYTVINFYFKIYQKNERKNNSKENMKIWLFDVRISLL